MQTLILFHFTTRTLRLMTPPIILLHSLGFNKKDCFKKHLRFQKLFVVTISGTRNSPFIEYI